MAPPPTLFAKAITLRSANGPETCTIDVGGGPYHRGFHIHFGESRQTRIKGFTITHGFMGVSKGYGAGIFIDDSSPPGDTIESIPLDLDGNPRFAADEIDFDPGCGIGAVVDMGAYELPGSPIHPVIVGDLDGSVDVTVTDLLALLAAWGPADGCVMADTDIDGAVGAADMLALLAHWS